LEEAAAIVGDSGDEECAGGGGPLRDGHYSVSIGEWDGGDARQVSGVVDFETKKYSLRQSGTRFALAGLWHA
jgi:hypothetical protein